MSTTAGMDSSMDEEGDESSLDAMCAQSTTDSGISLSPITSSNISLPVPSPTSSKSSPTHDALRQDGDSAYMIPDHTQPAAQQGTGSLELGQQPLAICPSAQQSASQEEEGPRTRESALTPDPPLSDCRAMRDAVMSDGAPDVVSVADAEDGETCNNELKGVTEADTVYNGERNDETNVVKEEIGQDPLDWTVADVVSYITSVGFPEQAAAFKTQEIDGKSLLLMQRSDVLTGLSIRLGPALKIYENHVKVLQRSHFQDDNRLFS
ncbi:sterile alpha motif domain containing 1a isoform X2 [Misgurnus anguillicaudatus]|nr:sterile alpha motif domain containing 1a isoform X2 [Misgurnus anguillicaudatus]XP_055042230.1 sterile alpha motif domain containing 1a isoform X2 [Misgurnus anguillicaudatus]